MGSYQLLLRFFERKNLASFAHGGNILRPDIFKRCAWLSVASVEIHGIISFYSICRDVPLWWLAQRRL